MKIVSTNIARPEIIEWRGQEIKTGIFKYEVEEPVFLEIEDVVNDYVIDRKYHGGKDKACYLYSADHYPFWKNKYPELKWEWGMFGENLTVTGLAESEIRIGDCFQVGDAVVQVSQPRQPCFKLGVRFGDQKVVDDFWESSFPGVYVRILHTGYVSMGNQFSLIESNPESLTVSQVFSIFRSNCLNFDLIKKAINEPFLAESCKNDIQRILERNEV